MAALQPLATPSRHHEVHLTPKGSIPIPYIVALVLAIAVIAIVVYWLFFSGSDFDRMLKEKGCYAKKLSYCNEYETSSTENIPPFAGPIGSTGEYYAQECCIFDEYVGSLDICD